MNIKITPLRNINEIHVMIKFDMIKDYEPKVIKRWMDVVEILRTAGYAIGNYCMNGGVVCNYDEKLLSHVFKFAYDFGDILEEEPELLPAQIKITRRKTKSAKRSSDVE